MRAPSTRLPVALLVGLCASCSGTVETAPDPDDARVGELCFAGGDDPYERPRTLAVSPVGDRLYVDLETADHHVRSLVLDLVDPERAVVITEAPQLAHGVDQRAWTSIGGARYARFFGSSELELMDASDVDAPRIASTVYAKGWTARDGAIGAAGDTLFFCADDGDGYGRTLLQVDVSDLDHPGEPSVADGEVCRGASFSRSAGALWADIGRNEPDGIRDAVRLFALGASPRLVASHVYDESDYATYGYLEDVIVGDELAAAWPEDDAVMFLYGDRIDGGFAAVPSVGRFRAIVGDVGFVASGHPVRLDAFDLGEPDAIVPVGTAVTFPEDRVWDGSELQLVGSDDAHLYFVSVSGDTYVVPRFESGQAAPLEVYAAPGAACPLP